MLLLFASEEGAVSFPVYSASCTRWWSSACRIQGEFQWLVVYSSERQRLSAESFFSTHEVNTEYRCIAVEKTSAHSVNL